MVDRIKIKEVGNKIIIDKKDFEKLISEVELIIETLEVLADKEVMNQIKESEKDIKDGRIHEIKSIDDFKAIILD